MARIVFSEKCDKARDSLSAGLRQRGHDVIIAQDFLEDLEKDGSVVDRLLIAVGMLQSGGKCDLVIVLNVYELLWFQQVYSFPMALVVFPFYFDDEKEWINLLGESLKESFEISEVLFFYRGFNTATLIETVEQMLSRRKNRKEVSHGADFGS